MEPAEALLSNHFLDRLRVCAVSSGFMKEMDHSISMGGKLRELLFCFVRDVLPANLFETSHRLTRRNRAASSVQKASYVSIRRFFDNERPMLTHQPGFEKQFYSRGKVNDRVFRMIFDLTDRALQKVKGALRNMLCRSFNALTTHARPFPD